MTFNLYMVDGMLVKMGFLVVFWNTLKPYLSIYGLNE